MNPGPSLTRAPGPWTRLNVCMGLAAALALSMAGPVQADAVLPRLELPDPMPAPPQTVLLPVPEARITQAIATLDDLGQDILERSGIPGLAIAVTHKGQTVYARGFGKRTVDTPEPVDADTVFLLASASKPIGATVVATQVDAGRVAWDSPVRDFLPWFDMGDAWVSDHVTIGDLYAHRSGLPDHGGDDLEDIGFDRRAVLDRLALLPMGRFRVDYAYTNFGLTAAAQAVAVAAGTDWASLSQEALYAPLGMTSTSSRHADYMARTNRAASHVPDGDGYAVSDRRQPDAQSPAGGVSSNVRDMARWMAMVLDGGVAGDTRLISESALSPALSPQMIEGPPMDVTARASTYGYGFNVGTRFTGRVMLSHSGAFAFGASTSVAMVPDLDLGIVVLTNAIPVGAAEAITASFLDRAEIGVSSRDWLAAYAPFMAPISARVGHLVGVVPPVDVVAARPVGTFAGTYESPYFGPASVVATDQGPILRLGPADMSLAMQHWDADTFVVQPVTENQPAGSVSAVEFAYDDTGQAFEMRVEHLNKEGLGVFRRHD